MLQLGLFSSISCLSILLAAIWCLPKYVHAAVTAHSNVKPLRPWLQSKFPDLSVLLLLMLKLRIATVNCAVSHVFEWETHYGPVCPPFSFLSNRFGTFNHILKYSLSSSYRNRCSIPAEYSSHKRMVYTSRLLSKMVKQWLRWTYPRCSVILATTIEL